MKKQEKQYVDWIKRMYHQYKSILFIEKYHLKVEKTSKEDDYYLASKFNYPYLDIKIFYSDNSLKDWLNNKVDAERRIVHEFCHTLTDPFYCQAVDRYQIKGRLEDERERLTDHIAQIVNKHFNGLSK